MYKNPYIGEKPTLWESFYAKGSFLACVSERDFMLTNFVYSIQAENRKTPYFRREFFCRAYHYF
jgi:hypothetical protein